jgi:hypothetical protein
LKSIQKSSCPQLHLNSDTSDTTQFSGVFSSSQHVHCSFQHGVGPITPRFSR